MKKSAFITESALGTPELLRELAGLGYRSLYVETPEPRRYMVNAATAAGCELWFSVPCFSDHLERDRPWRRPILRAGTPKPQLEWYRGISPLDSDRISDVARRVARAAALEPAGLVFDFIRWPVHWELEFRPDWGDPLSPADGDLHIYDPSDPSTRSDLMQAAILRAVRTFARAARDVRSNIQLASTIVPITTSQQHEVVAQPHHKMAQVTPVLMPMLYFGMVHESPLWIQDVMKKLRTAAPQAKFTPILQVTGSGTHSGTADWGEPPSPEELEEALATLFELNVDEIVIFLGDDLEAATSFAKASDAANLFRSARP